MASKVQTDVNYRIITFKSNYIDQQSKTRNYENHEATMIHYKNVKLIYFKTSKETFDSPGPSQIT